MTWATIALFWYEARTLQKMPQEGQSLGARQSAVPSVSVSEHPVLAWPWGGEWEYAWALINEQPEHLVLLVWPKCDPKKQGLTACCEGIWSERWVLGGILAQQLPSSGAEQSFDFFRPAPCCDMRDLTRLPAVQLGGDAALKGKGSCLLIRDGHHHHRFG